MALYVDVCFNVSLLCQLKEVLACHSAPVIVLTVCDVYKGRNLGGGYVQSIRIQYIQYQGGRSWRASGDRQISLNASAERAFANFRDKKHRILQLQIFAT